MSKDIFYWVQWVYRSNILDIIKKIENFNVKLLTTNSNVIKIYEQAIFDVKEIVIFDKKEYFTNLKNLKKYKSLFIN